MYCIDFCLSLPTLLFADPSFPSAFGRLEDSSDGRRGRSRQVSTEFASHHQHKPTSVIVVLFRATSFFGASTPDTCPFPLHFCRLSKQPDIAVSVDLLVVLLADEDGAVRKAAMEVYLRRVYRAHCIKTLTISETDGVISAEWAFTTR